MRTDTRGARAIRWIEDYCVVPGGPEKGQHVRLSQEQRETVRRIYDGPQGSDAEDQDIAKSTTIGTLANVKLAFVEINVLPPQPAQFAAAQSGENCRQQQRSALAGRGVNNLPDFVGGRDIRPAVAADVFSVWNATGPALGNAVHRADAHEIKRRAAGILVLPQAQG